MTATPSPEQTRLTAAMQAGDFESVLEFTTAYPISSRAAVRFRSLKDDEKWIAEKARQFWVRAVGKIPTSEECEELVANLYEQFDVGELGNTRELSEYLEQVCRKSGELITGLSVIFPNVCPGPKVTEVAETRVMPYSPFGEPTD